MRKILAEFAIDCMKISKNILVVAYRDGSINVHSLISHRTYLLQSSSTTPVTHLDHNGTTLVTGCKQQVGIWDLATRKYLRTLTLAELTADPPDNDSNVDEAFLVGLEILGESEMFSTVCCDGVVKIWRLPQPRGTKCLAERGREPAGDVSSFEMTSFQSHYQVLYVKVIETSNTTTEYTMILGLRSGDIASCRIILHPTLPVNVTFHSHLIFESTKMRQFVMAAIDWDAISGVVVSGGWDGVLKVWDGRNARLIRSFATDGFSPVTSLVRMGKVVVTGHYNGTLCIWDFGK